MNIYIYIAYYFGTTRLWALLKTLRQHFPATAFTTSEVYSQGRMKSSVFLEFPPGKLHSPNTSSWYSTVVLVESLDKCLVRTVLRSADET